MKRRIEAGDLRQLWLAFEQEADRSQVVRLMERRKRYEFFEHGEYIGVEPDWFRVLHPTVDDPMAHRRKPEAPTLAAQKLREMRHGRIVAEVYSLAPGLLG